MLTFLMTKLNPSKEIRNLTLVIVSHSSARTMSSRLALDSFANNEEILLASAKPFEEIPSVKTFPVVGSSWIYFPLIGKYSITKLHIADMEKYKMYGPIFRETFGSQVRVNIFDPEDVEKMFRHEGKYPTRSGSEAISAYKEHRKELYKTLDVTNLQGKEWYDMRFKIQAPLLGPKIIEPYISPMENVTKDFINKISYLRDENEEVPHFHEEIYKWALESVGFMILNTRLGCLDRNLPEDSEGLRMIQSLLTAEECGYKLHSSRGSMQLWKYFPTPTWRKFVNAMDFLTSTASKYVDQAVGATKNKDEDKKPTLLQFMLNIPGLDESYASSTISAILKGGIVATSNIVGFLLYRLARNPSVQEKLYEEIVRVFPNRSDKQNFAAFNELRYLKACIKEAMRMDPLVRRNFRILDHEVVLSGYRIPAGVHISAMLQAASRQEKYIREANQFIPERWLNKEDKPHPFLFLPYGFGPRSCIGRRFADLQIMSIVIELLRNYKLEYHHEDIGIITKITNYPDRPLKFKFIDRPI